jgi:tRNA(Ile)-lysidine synthase TilS/MesJ
VKKHRFQPGVAHIDDGGLCGQSVDERNNVKHHIEKLTQISGFPFHAFSLADLFLPQGKEQQNVSEGVKKLQELFENVTTVTAKEDLLSHLYRNLLQKIAKDDGYDYIMVGDCGSNIAVRILADIAQGRGSQLPFNVSFKDGRSEVLVLRPMREFTKKEIQFYNCFNDVTSFTIPSFTTKASSHGSVNRLTEELIISLQAGFPSTLNTVLRTGDKLSSNAESKDSQHCVLCLAPLGIYSGFSEVVTELTACGECGGNASCQNDSGGMYTGDGRVGSKNDGGNDVDSTDGSFRGMMISDRGTTGDSSDHNITPGSDDGMLRVSSGQSSTHIGDQNTKDHGIVKSLCYGCKLTYHDVKDGEMLLPDVITEKSKKQFQQNAMKECIQDFLLD